MKQTKPAADLHRAFILLLVCALSCLAALTGLTVRTLHEIAAGQRAHADTFVPAKRLTAGYEREVLNARIFFIYFVTIQKPGSLASGWERFHNAEAVIAKMAVMAKDHEELANLRGPVAQLQKDFANYTEALTATLAMVQSGELNGPHYDAQVKDWAARGATMVKDAATVENLTFKTGEANTNDIARQLREGQINALLLLAFSLFLCTLATLLVRRRIQAAFAEAAGPHSPAFTIHSPLNAGAH